MTEKHDERDVLTDLGKELVEQFGEERACEKFRKPTYWEEKIVNWGWYSFVISIFVMLTFAINGRYISTIPPAIIGGIGIIARAWTLRRHGWLR